MVTSGRCSRWLLYVCLGLCCVAVSCSSSTKNGSNGGGATGLIVSPASTATLDLGQTLSVTASQTVTWGLQNACGLPNPAGTLSQQTGTTVVYNAPTPASSAQTCPNSATFQFQDEIVATDSQNQSAELVVGVASPVTIQHPTSFSYSGTGCTGGVPCCPPAGTVISGPPNLPINAGIVGSFLSVGNITATGGVPPYTWRIASGASSLPNGLALGTTTDRSSGQSDAVIQGTPIAPGCSTYTIEVSDSTAQANCDPTVQGPCAQAALDIVVLPSSLKVQVPNYPSSYNDEQATGDPGVPYPPTAYVASGGQAPYFWCQNPGYVVGSVLPTGLEMNSLMQPNFDCPSAVSQSNSAVVSGIPTPNTEINQNNCNGAASSSGCWYTQLQVTDSQQPYPAVGVATLAKMADLPLISCSQANQPPSLNSVPNNSYLQGPMAFLLRGFDANGPVVIAGSVTVNGDAAGTVAGGVMDVTRSGAHQQLTIQSGNYVVGTLSFLVGQAGTSAPSGSDYSRGCMTLSLANNGAPAGTTTFAFTLGGCSNHYNQNGVTVTSSQACGFTTNNQVNQAAGTYTTGHIVEFDDNTGQGTRASGILRAQDSSSFSGGLSGPYAFGMGGGDAAQKHYAIAGSLTASAGSLTSVAADIDDAGTLASNLTGGTGTYAVDATYGASNGRWSAALSLNSGATTFDQALYMVSSSEALIATTDPLNSSHPILGGEAITTAGSFSNLSLQNSQILRMGGLAASGPDVSIGVLSFDGNGNLSGTEYEDQAGTVVTTSISGAYNVDPATGRAAQAAALGQNLGPHPFVAYVIPAPANLSRTNCTTPAACVTGFVVGTDSTAQDGILEFQTPTMPLGTPPPPLNNRYISGNYSYGTAESLDPLTPNLEGDVFATPSGSSTTSGAFGPFIQDVNYGDPSYYCVSHTLCYLLMPNQALTGSYSINPNGTGSFGGGVVSVANGNAVFYIDESPENLHPSVIVAEQ